MTMTGNDEPHMDKAWWDNATQERLIQNDIDEIYNKRIASVAIWFHTTVLVTLTILGINGTLLNGLVLRYFWIRRKKQTSYNLTLINLALVELVIATCGVSLDVTSLIKNGWVLGSDICIISGTIVTTSGFVSMLTLCVLSVLGYGSVSRYEKRKGRDSSKDTDSTTIIIIILIWLYALALSLPPIFGWGRYVPEISGLGCTPDWHSEKSSKSYIVYIMFFGFCIPTLIIIISSLLTYVEGGCFRFACLTRKKNPDQNKQGNRDDVDLRLIVAMNITYLACWSPYAILCFVHTFVSKTLIGPMLSMVPTITVKMSVCANPILYIAYNPRSKQSAKISSQNSTNFENENSVSGSYKSGKSYNVGSIDARESLNMQPLRCNLQHTQSYDENMGLNEGSNRIVRISIPSYGEYHQQSERILPNHAPNQFKYDRSGFHPIPNLIVHPEIHHNHMEQNL